MQQGTAAPQKTLAHRAALAAAVMIAFATPLSHAQGVVVRTVVGQESVYFGESFFLQIQVTGGKNVEMPDVSGLSDFDPRLIPLERMPNTLVPQLRAFNLTEGTNYLYRLTPPSMGTVTIPAMAVMVDGHPYSTAAVTLEVKEPPPSADYRLTLTLSKTRAYVGESLKLTAVWYSVKDTPVSFFAVPILGSASFTIPEIANANTSSGGYRYYRGSAARTSLPPGLTGRQGTAVLNHIQYKTMTYDLTVIPSKPGRFDFPPATVQIFNTSDNGSFGNRGFRGFFASPDTVVASRPLSITVLPVPLDGRPTNYSGIVSDTLSLKVAVAPETMSVGDPVNLSLTLSGPPSLASVQLPPVQSLGELGSSFALPSEAPRITTGAGDRTFSAIVRLKNADAREVPALAIPYFNTRTGAYALARSAPVPISVRPTQAVTASDLVGVPGTGGGNAAPASVRTWEAGIFYNYAGASALLAPQAAGIGSYVRGPVVPVAVAVPLLVFAAALLLAFRRRAVARWPGRATASPFLGIAEAVLGAEPGARAESSEADTAALEQLRESLGTRLSLPPGRLTWVDLEAALRGRGIEESLIEELGSLFGGRELESYSGQRNGRNAAELSVRERIARAASRLAKLLP